MTGSLNSNEFLCSSFTVTKCDKAATFNQRVVCQSLCQGRFASCRRVLAMLLFGLILLERPTWQSNQHQLKHQVLQNLQHRMPQRKQLWGTLGLSKNGHFPPLSWNKISNSRKKNNRSTMSSGVSSDTSRNQFRNWASCEQARRCFETATTTSTSQGACSSGFLRELHQNKKVDISLLSWHFSFALLWHPLTIGKFLQETDRLSAMRSRTQGIRPSTCQSSAGYPGEQMSFDKGTNCSMQAFASDVKYVRVYKVNLQGHHGSDTPALGRSESIEAYSFSSLEVQIVEGLWTVFMVLIPKHVPKGCQHSRCVSATMQQEVLTLRSEAQLDLVSGFFRRWDSLAWVERVFYKICCVLQTWHV